MTKGGFRTNKECAMKQFLALLAVLILLASGIAYAEGEGGALLILNYGTESQADYKAVGEVRAPSGYVPIEGISPNTEGAESELYYKPEDSASSVRFFYYTTGNGDSAELAQKLPEMYASFYEDFTAEDVRTESVLGNDWLIFSYRCSYPNADGTGAVYEQTAVCYRQLGDVGYVACIVSAAFAAPEEYYASEGLRALIESAISAVEFKQ
jgi:hypothetical protein